MTVGVPSSLPQKFPKQFKKQNKLFRGGINLDRYIMVMLGGGLGSLARYVLGTAINVRIGGRLPLGTMVINITGSFLIGALMVLLTERLQLNPNWRLLLVAGFLGGYTTFSSFEFETYQAIRDGRFWLGMLNVLGSVILGFAGVWLGAALARK
jgi:CrcB protein